ncbi:MAG: HEAT repeat domain-containing protein, partial [Planctomycetia bacterium]
AARKERQQEYYRVVRTAMKGLRQDRADRREESLKALQRLDDPLAVEPLLEVLGAKGEPGERRLMVDLLTAIETPESTDGLLKTAVSDADPDNRAAAAEALTPRKTPELVGRTVRWLRSVKNDEVRSAAVVLEAIGDETAVPALVDALITKHEQVLTIADQNRLGMGRAQKLTQTIIQPDGTIRKYRNPLAGTPGPQGPITITEEKRNDEVRAALMKITGQDFGYDKTGWLTWMRREYREKPARAE